MSTEIIGITGRVAAGKDTVAEYLAQKLEMPVFRMSDPLKKLAAHNGFEPTRANLVALGTALADKYGDEWLGNYVLDQAPQSFIVSGIRQLGQIAIFGSTDRFHLVAVDAPPPDRYDRMIKRGDRGSPQTFDQFVRDEARENSPPNIQRVDKCMEQAEYTIMNDGSIDDLHCSIDEFLLRL